MDRYLIVGCLVGLVVTAGGLLITWFDEHVERPWSDLKNQGIGFFCWLLIIVGVFIVGFTLLLEALLKGL